MARPKGSKTRFRHTPQGPVPVEQAKSTRPREAAPGATPNEDSAPASVVTGAESEVELQAQAAAAELGVKPPRGTSATTLSKRRALIADAEELKRKRETTLNLCRMIAPIPFEAVAQLSGEPKWATYLHKPIDPDGKQSRVDMIAEAYARVCEAWGFDFTGKYTALSIVVAANLRVAGNIASEIAREKPENTEPEKAKPEMPVN